MEEGPPHEVVHQRLGGAGQARRQGAASNAACRVPPQRRHRRIQQHVVHYRLLRVAARTQVPSEVCLVDARVEPQTSGVSTLVPQNSARFSMQPTHRSMTA